MDLSGLGPKSLVIAAHRLTPIEIVHDDG
jgi:hypothetical protein